MATDSTLGDASSTGKGSSMAKAKAAKPVERYIDAAGATVEVWEGRGEVSLAFLKSYEDIGMAEVRT